MVDEGRDNGINCVYNIYQVIMKIIYFQQFNIIFHNMYVIHQNYKYNF